MGLGLYVSLMKFLVIFIMDQERAWYGFVYGLGCVFTFMDWMTHGKLRMARYPLFLGFLACESLTGMMDIGIWLKMVFIQNDRVCFAASDLPDSNNFRDAGRAPGIHEEWIV